MKTPVLQIKTHQYKINLLWTGDEGRGTEKYTSYSGSEKFKEVTLCPKVIVADESMIEKTQTLHAEAAKMCFIANSCNFVIKHRPSIATGKVI